jgi:hypothetical protein
MKVVDKQKALQLIYQYTSPYQMMHPDEHFRRRVGEGIVVDIDSNCKNCAAPLNYDHKRCEYCGTQISLK